LPSGRAKKARFRAQNRPVKSYPQFGGIATQAAAPFGAAPGAGCAKAVAAETGIITRTVNVARHLISRLRNSGLDAAAL